MLTTILRKSGGSVTVTIPRTLLAILDLAAGDVMGLEIDGQALVLRKPRRLGKGRGKRGTAEPVGVGER